MAEAAAQALHQFASFTVGLLGRQLAQHKQERGQVSFDDMITRLDEALSESNPYAPLLLEALRRRFACALVDEFQDTDAIQWRIFRRIFVGPPEHALFVIGDPKQAIYGFRGADVHAYLSAVEQLRGQHQAQHESLPENWRSLPQLIEAINCFFAKDWFTGGISYQPVSAPAPEKRRARLHEDMSGRPPMSIVDLSALQTAAGKQVLRHYASFVADEIKRLLTKGSDGRGKMAYSVRGQIEEINESHICILVRKASDAQVFEKALRRAKIEFSLYRKPGLWQSDEATHLYYLLKAIESPQDQAALKKALFTRFFHVPEAGGYGLKPALNRLACEPRGDGPKPAPQTGGRRPIRPDELWQYESLLPSHPLKVLFAKWFEQAQRRQWPLLFRSILEDTGVLCDEIREDDGERRIANYQQIVQSLEHEAIARNLDIHGVMQLLVNYRRQYVQAEEQWDIHRQETEKPKVLILTMHKSKGLEFPIVFVAGGFTPDPKPAYFKCHEGGHVVYDLTCDESRAARVEMEQAEEDQRLYYVALTRAMYKVYFPVYAPSDVKTPKIGRGLKMLTEAAARTAPSSIRQRGGSF